MKERNFYSDEFEELIREKTDQYKMYPSDKVWKGIYGFLHTKRRRYIIGMSLLVTGILFFAGKELLVPSQVNKIISGPAVTSSGNPDTSLPVSPSAFSVFQKENNDPVPVAENLLSATVQSSTVPVAVTSMNPVQELGLINMDAVATVNDNLSVSVNKEPQPATVENKTLLTSGSVPIEIAIGNDVSASQAVVLNAVPVADPAQLAAINAMARENKQMKWLKENASYELTSIAKRNKLKWEVYGTPTFSYRKLSPNGAYAIKTNTQAGPVAVDHSGDPNGYVDQKPQIGFQLGGAIVYRLTRNLSLKAGLQFDYSRYAINAYATSTEPAIIALNSFNGYSYNTVTSYTNIRNFGGTSPRQIENRYYQISVPIGLEMRVMGNGKLQLNVAGSLAPTYLINRDIYMLTTDYTNYTKEPSLVRRWNVNGAIEAFLSYDMGSFRLQAGPQFRYQFLSSFSNEYSLKENLMQYGLKIGVTKTIR